MIVTEEIRKIMQIKIGNISLEGELIIPEGAKSLVIFSHGSGSSRFSPRNNYVAGKLHERRIGTFLFDLLTKEEDAEYENRFNIPLLTQRLIDATLFLQTEAYEIKGMKTGYFGASTGAASAICAAADSSVNINAVVSRGGRPDLSGKALSRIKCPVLMIVGGNDKDVIKLNELAHSKMKCLNKLEIVKGATHLFDEPGTLEAAAKLASDWFDFYLA